MPKCLNKSTPTIQHRRPRHASPDFSPHGLGLIVVRAYAQVWSRPFARAPTVRRFYGFVKLVLRISDFRIANCVQILHITRV